MDIRRENTGTVFVILGVTGDLAKKKLFPALFDLYIKKLLPENFAIVGFSRREMNTDEFRRYVTEIFNERHTSDNKEELSLFISHFTYVQGQFDDQHSYIKLSVALKEIDDSFGQCTSKLFYLSVPPNLYEMIFTNLSTSKLTVPCGGNIGWTRILVEKPFGHDIKTAKGLDKLLGKLFQEEQIFRIDHYLAKETLQNILAFRFSNTIFEPIWNKKYIEKIEIHLFEKNDVSGRGSFYESIGALRDVGQNHLLQMLALISMEKPESFTGEDVRKKRSKVLAKLKKPKSAIKSEILRAQYDGWNKEKGVQNDNQTETYFSLKAEINNRRWRGVPFYLRSGKALNESKAEIKIYFKDPDPSSYLPQQFKLQEQNILTFSIQPNEGISVLFWVKVPGFDFKIEPKKLSFQYKDNSETADKKLPDAYEKVLFDCISGDQTLFASTDEVLAEWQFITPVLELFKKITMRAYNKGSDWTEIK